jgi:hypothetical protein
MLLLLFLLSPLIASLTINMACINKTYKIRVSTASLTGKLIQIEAKYVLSKSYSPLETPAQAPF